MSADRGTVVVVDPYSSGALYAPKLRAAGFRVVAVLTASRPPAIWVDTYRPDELDQVHYALDGPARLAVARTLADQGVRAVLPGCESGVTVADQLASMLTPALANVPQLATARRHKGAMQDAARTAGIPVADHRTCQSPEELEQWLADHRPERFVLKPASSAGTDSVAVLDGTADWRSSWARVHGRRNLLDLVNDEIIVQEFLEGTEWVVDTLSTPEGHAITDVIRYTKRLGSYGSPQYDSLEFVEAGVASAVGLLDYATAVLDAVGMRFGPAHLEIITTDAGPRLVEINCRVVGGGLPLAAAAATGEGPLNRLVRQLVDGGLPDVYRLRRPTAVAFLRVDRPGVVETLDSVLQVRDLASYWWDEIEVRPGQAVTPPTDLIQSVHLGMVGLQNADAGQLHRDLETFRRLEHGFLRPTG